MSFTHRFRRSAVAAVATLALALAPTGPARAAGDLLVAPTRLILDSPRGSEVILNNIGSAPATYRISLELRRMTPDGRLDEVPQDQATPHEKQALTLVRYAPRLVTLPPNQPQAVRVGAVLPPDLPDGEYRVHMLFRAIPDAKPVEAPKPAGTGLAIQLTPIYGVTIPIIVRKGNLHATASLAHVRIDHGVDGPALAFDLSRTGDRSVYGDIRVTSPGSAQPILVARGIAIYPEVDHRVVSFPVSADVLAKLHGPVKVGYYEPLENGGGLIAETEATL